MRNQQNVKVKVNSSFETICPFPVGYVYMSQTNTSPGSIYGGTWASISGGRYMRAASAWGNGGSNIISIQNLPAHAHSLQGNILAFQGGKGNSSLNGGSSVDILTHLGINTSMSTGGGQHSIQHTRMCMLGTELPKEGERSCVTFNKFKFVLQAALRRFVHSQLVTFICQPIQQVQQALTVVRGHLSQMLDSCDQVARGTHKAVKARIHSLFQRCPLTLTLQKVVGAVRAALTSDGYMIIRNTLATLHGGLVHIWKILAVELHTITFHLIVPATVGIEPSKQIRGEW